jgi:DNA-binding CsgD family transcriptional regulator
VVRDGLVALTASERRVARMAAEGLTISEIAQGPFVTRKTVETHLYAAYRKLDVHSRDDLAAALARDEEGEVVSAIPVPGGSAPGSHSMPRTQHG